MPRGSRRLAMLIVAGMALALPASGDPPGQDAAPQVVLPSREQRIQRCVDTQSTLDVEAWTTYAPVVMEAEVACTVIRPPGFDPETWEEDAGTYTCHVEVLEVLKGSAPPRFDWSRDVRFIGPGRPADLDPDPGVYMLWGDFRQGVFKRHEAGSSIRRVQPAREAARPVRGLSRLVEVAPGTLGNDCEAQMEAIEMVLRREPIVAGGPASGGVTWADLKAIVARYVTLPMGVIPDPVSAP